MTEENEEKISFSVAENDWTPLLHGGATTEVGLREALQKAHLFEAVRHPIPLVECGIYRLLIAFALDIFPMENRDDWQKLWDAKQFDSAQIAAYFAEHEKFFDLFDETHPFLQSASADVEGNDKSLANLLPSQPSGSFAVHFHHGHESDFAVSPAAAAQLLTTVAPFMVAGGAGLSPSINGAPPWYILLRGKTLFQTLLLNALAIRELSPTLKNGVAPEIPTWRDGKSIVKEDKTQASLLQSLSWRPRRIRLLPHFAPHRTGVCAISGRATPVLVAKMKFSAGWSTRIEGWRDPNAAYRTTKAGTTILRPREGRALWRDSGALLLTRETSGDEVKYERPLVISQYGELVDKSFDAEDVPLRVLAYGMRTDLKMKVFEWQREEAPLDAALVWKTATHGALETALRRAEEVSTLLRRAIRRVYPRDAAGNDKGFDTLAVRAQTSFWETMRAPFFDYLHQLARTGDDDFDAQNAAAEDWNETLEKTARRVLADAISGLDTDGEIIKRQIAARKFFAIQLFNVLHPETAAQRKAQNKKSKGAAA